MLRQRIISALVLAPVALAAVWYGSWAFVALSAVAAVLLAWEWTRLCLGEFGAGGIVLAVMGAGVSVLGLVAPTVALPVIAAAALLAPFLQSNPGRSRLWLLAGGLYIGLPTLALVWIRDQGRITLFWALFLVWATDIGAFIAGRTIGGPKLLPRISPKKTWAGLAGGVLSAAMVGAVMASFSDIHPASLALLSGVLAVVAQAGDLAESWVKRHFGVKDSSGIIPGHGGVLDRLDGLLAVAPVVAALCLAFRGGLPE